MTEGPTLDAFQRQLEALYLERDRARGSAGTFAWFVEEVGELSRALRRDDRENLIAEFGDAFAWLTSLASLNGVSITEAVAKYFPACPKCAEKPCTCPGARL